MTYVNKSSVTAIGIVFPVLVMISLAARACGWRKYSRNLEIDDILIVPAALLTIAAGAAMVIGAQMNIIGGHSVPVITPTEQHQLGKFEYAFWIAHVLDIGFIKLALLFLFRRIFKSNAFRTPFDYANWTLIILVILWTVVFLFFEVFACGADPSVSWSDLYSLRQKCVDTFAMQTGCAVFSWIMDLAILVEPLFMIAPLKMSFRKKLQVCLVFFCSIFAVVAGLLRMIVWIQIEVQGTTNPQTKVLDTVLPSVDQEGIVSIILFWTYVEIGVGFQVACLPPCARHLDKLSLSRLMIKLGSLPSVLSISKRSPDSNRHLTSSYKPQKSRSDDEIELYKIPGPNQV
ncbi:uncharacterized protein ATNIH1004_011344 [Aspergillus tanneri]|uniref:Rhodopsin domain-containing protein n=1 Tax=Aspergillus tanneri TaxID=1220188 RepID=A0A5M9MAD2_9EURO|nr:uncharacterized protein ATNIH1004_011344 [Aspergillus tanneri]KAA8642400.1 hypothetical protein ATNIH1004_011344 [Aspergillus tanneri]